MSKKPRGKGVAKGETPTAPNPAAIAGQARRAHLRRELAGITLLLAAVFIAGSLLAGGTAGRQSCATAGGIFGPVGACLRSGVLLTLGALSAIIVPFIPAVHALRLLGRIEESEDRRWLFFTVGLAAIVPVTAALARGSAFDASLVDPLAGLVGGFVAFYLTKAFGLGGAWVVVALALSTLMAGTLAWNPIRMLIGGSAKRHVGAADTQGVPVAAVAAGVAAAGDSLSTAERLEPDSREMPSLDFSLLAAPTLVAGQETAQVELALEENADALGSGRFGKKRKATKAERSAEHAEAVAAAINADTDSLDTVADELPPAELLTPAPARNVEQSRAHLDAMGQKLMDALRTFKVDGQLVGRTTGPTVTQYEIERAGVKSASLRTSRTTSRSRCGRVHRIVAPVR
jgi:S-DNA-T family DNA segregation ATPase FtsK/SpoIIIE